VRGGPGADPLPQPVSNGARQHDDTVLVALALADEDLAAVQVDVLDAQLAAFEQAKAAAIEKVGEQAEDAVAALDGLQDPANLVGCQDDGQSP
jgi:hypothetical protein